MNNCRGTCVIRSLLCEEDPYSYRLKVIGRTLETQRGDGVVAKGVENAAKEVHDHVLVSCCVA